MSLSESDEASLRAWCDRKGMRFSDEAAGSGGQTPLLRLSGTVYPRAHSESWDTSLELGYLEATDFQTVIARVWYGLVTDQRRRHWSGELALQRSGSLPAWLASRTRRSAPYRALGDRSDAFSLRAGTGVTSWLAALPSWINRIEVSGEYALMAFVEWRFSETKLDRVVALVPETHAMLDDVVVLGSAVE